MDPALPTLWTLGHSNRSLLELVALLRHLRLATVVDIRRYPGSRRHPHFSRDLFGPALEAEGIGYVHEPDLGGMREGATDSPNDALAEASLRAYADHMATGAFRRALARVLTLAEKMELGLMCAEADPAHCHRQILSDLLVARGHQVIHALNLEKQANHILHPAVRRRDSGMIVYSGGKQLDIFGRD